MCALFTGPGFSAQVTLARDRNPEQDIAGYRIYYGTASRLYNWFVDVGNVATYTVTGLPEDGGTYFFAATAYDTSQVESTYSIEAVLYQSFVEPMLNEIAIGTQLTISGSNLGAKKGKVFVGSAPAKFLSWDNTSIICVVN
jgi:IPT/TIG domain